AVSDKMTIDGIYSWALKKGIGLIATGDWTHPLWIREIKEKLVETGRGTLQLKPVLETKLKTQNSKLENPKEPEFLLATEISSIYTQGGKQRRVHNLVWAPTIAVADSIIAALIKRGCNLGSDGRPIVGLTSKEIAELVFSIDETCLIIPAHAWTPWFALYGSKSGFDSVEECFGDYAKYIYAVETGLSCYDEKTEVLTRDGWKKFNEVTYDDKICTLNKNTSEIEYQKPTKIHTYQYKGKMYLLKTKRVDLMVTPNHKLLYSPCDFRKEPQFYLKEAEFLFNKSKRFKKSGVWEGKNDDYFILPAAEIRHGSRYYSGLRSKKEKKLAMKPWLKFFGLWIAEGWTNEGKNGAYAVCLANQDDNLLTEMKEVLESFGYRVYWDNKTNHTIRVRDYQLFHYLKQFGKSSEKFIPPETKSLSKELLEIFFNYYIAGDGHRYGRTNKGLSATTISIRLRDDLQEIALKMGISAYYKLGNRKGTPILSLSKAKSKGYKQSKDSWIIYFIRKNLHTVLPSTVKKRSYIETWVNFTGPVYCVTVPNHVLYIRRNGIPVWCGNSDPVMNWEIPDLDHRSIVSFSDAHSGPKLGREATVFELQELSYGAIREAIMSYQVSSIKYKAEQKNKIACTFEFYPEEGKYHYTGHRNCNVRQTPEETKQQGVICHVCGRPLTVGVMHRVQELSQRTVTPVITHDEHGVRWVFHPQKKRPPFVNIVPLLEILSEALNSGVSSQNVIAEYEKLITAFDGEFNVLLKADISAIEQLTSARTAQSIKKVRAGDIFIDPGYDGVFGVVKVWKDEKDEAVKKDTEQMGLF
ncbi:hypothetical protein HY468_01705, partial [Candidatus Roizmanbacteria bacterium]|nr:hypothetical protein [Candidatus Roizmanbacteria bacterium]